MGLVPMKDLLIKARTEGYAVGAFEFWSLDSAQAVVEAASGLNMPVILQAGPLECQYAGLGNIVKIARMAADEVAVPVALHLDHAEEFDLICKAIDAGFTSVMIDASHKDYAENMKLTRQVVLVAQKTGVTVEAELGKLAGSEAGKTIQDEEAAQTDPDEARRYVEETGIDALAIAIGTAHGFYTFEPKINIERLRKIAAKVSIPLVLHGGSGTPEKKIVESIRYGITKINICTEFVAAYGKGYIQTQNSVGFKYSVPSLFGPAKQAGKDLVASKIKLFSSNK